MIDDVKTAPLCEAAYRNQQAIQELEVQWGTRKLDFGKLRNILTGECDVRDHD